MNKYIKLFGILLIIFFAFFAISTRNVTAETTTGGANAYTCTVNDINYNIDLNAAPPVGFDSWELFFDEFPSCKTPPSPTPTPSVTPTPTQEITPTPTPQPSTNNGGGGSGVSDGRSDGLSSCPSCTQAPSGPIKAVLGLSTTSGEENYLLQFVQLFGALTFAGLGFVFFKKNA
jgi:hypothetical protein